MAARKTLKKYQQKRDFTATPAPTDVRPKLQHPRPKPTFVVHMHRSSHLHYELRLEVNGVLVSWVIPKGPSLDPAVRRIAMKTENHPIEYAQFEGVIPRGNYGAGTTIIWDRGTFRNLSPSTLSRCIDSGQLQIWFDGKKLQGGWTLTRVDEKWLFVKMKDAKADVHTEITDDQPYSVVSGLSVEEIAAHG